VLGTAGILWIGGREVLAGNLTVGSILVFISYLAALYAPLNSLMYTSSTLQGAMGSARRVFEVLDTAHDVTDRPGAITLSKVRGHVRIENASYGYAPGEPFLKNINLEAQPGETVAIVGATGAGKSTVVGLIPRFFDVWEGRVLVDGHDVRNVQLRSLRRQISLVLQEPLLFPISIAENIAYGRPEASRREVEEAARSANAHRFIERLPQGYDTLLGERGATLSGGERQRLSIARALLKDAPILILDEPTSALDAETEALLLEALERLMAGRTTFIIAHRLSTIRKATRILVLQEGEIAECGSHQELLQKQGVYRHLHDLQFGHALLHA
jgi:ATP-binding cassette subfamily B protein/subfamily B ATP-binding cassette protein MsbA